MVCSPVLTVHRPWSRRPSEPDRGPNRTTITASRRHQGQPVAAEAIQCSQCASECRSSCKVTSLSQLTLQNECAVCKRKATERCKANCYGGCGRPSCPGCHCQRMCNCRDAVEASCDDICSRAAQACRDCTTRCKANCFN